MKLVLTLKAVRAERNLSQVQLSQEAEVSQVTLSHIENGKVRPFRSTKEKIEEAIGPVDWERTFSDGLINKKEKP